MSSYVQSLTPELFWDVDLETIDDVSHRRFVSDSVFRSRYGKMTLLHQHSSQNHTGGTDAFWGPWGQTPWKFGSCIVGSLLLGVSITIKHIFVFMPIWLLFRRTGWRTRLCGCFIPLFVFAGSFIPYMGHTGATLWFAPVILFAYAMCLGALWKLGRRRRCDGSGKTLVKC